MPGPERTLLTPQRRQNSGSCQVKDRAASGRASHQRGMISSVDWFGVRCVFRGPGGERLFEERVTLWQADSFEVAVKRAEKEAREYASVLSLHYLGLAQAYRLPHEPADGSEVFSLIRESGLDDAAYIDSFFDTGTERQWEM